MNRRQEVGMMGEGEAAEYLKKKRYTILKKNYWKPWGELDIIARAGDTTLVFIEVKTIKTNLTNQSNDFINPEDNMTRAKIIKTKRAAELYANAHGELITDRGWRIDLITVLIDGNLESHITHYENIY